MTDNLFPGFQRRRIAANGIEVNTVVGPRVEGARALLLLHGYPQTLAIWHKVAPHLARRYNVVATDLRGYGDSAKPPGGARHEAYAKRTMAEDQVAVMRELGFDRFLLCGHDRGGRVSHRLAVDHPGAVEKVAVLDIAPTLAMYEQTTEAFARAYWHWFFLILPEPIPERMIGVDPKYILRSKMGAGKAGMKPFAPEAWAEYERCYTPETIHASCEGYRAAGGIDLEHDRADRGAQRKVKAPLLALWGDHGIIGRLFDPLAEWKRVAGDVRGKGLPSGHYIAEEVPDLLAGELETFFGEGA